MIEYIKGEIVELTPARMILECAGIGYELNISLNTYTFYNGKPTGKIYVYEVIREDAHLLFGFAGKDERELFLMLTGGSSSVAASGAVTEEAVAALVMLGFQKAASQKAVNLILKGSPALAVEQVIKTALRML